MCCESVCSPGALTGVTVMCCESAGSPGALTGVTVMCCESAGSPAALTGVTVTLYIFAASGHRSINNHQTNISSCVSRCVCVS